MGRRRRDAGRCPDVNLSTAAAAVKAETKAVSSDQRFVLLITLRLPLIKNTQSFCKFTLKEYFTILQVIAPFHRFQHAAPVFPSRRRQKLKSYENEKM